MSDASVSTREPWALVVDDDDAIVHLVRAVLEGIGFHVETAGNGAKGLDMASNHSFDVIITDLAMPEMSGMEFLRKAREKKLPGEFVVLTAVGSVPSAVEAMRCGAFEFLEKPVPLARLRAVADAALRRRKASLGPPAARSRPSNIPSGAQRSTGSPPSRIGRYEVLDSIGRGGMGEVFRCRDPLIERTVAVKTMRIEGDRVDRTTEVVARFQREAAAAGKLAHPGIVEVYDVGRDYRLGLWFMVLEYIDGRSLAEILASRGRLPPADVSEVGFQVADSLAYAHARGVVHRDVKPGNILINRDGNAKLLDFGIAGIQGSSLTQTGQFVGSPTYAAPERIHGEHGGPAADQFSLGVVLYELLSDSNPFDADSFPAQLANVLHWIPESIERFVPDVPPGLATLITRLMEKEPARRYASTDEVVNALALVGAEYGRTFVRHEE